MNIDEFSKTKEYEEVTCGCQCSSIDHCVRFSLVTDEPTIMVELILNPTYGFWRRLWSALVYTVSPYNTKYGRYAEVLLKHEDVLKLTKQINMYGVLKQLKDKAHKHNGR